MHNRETYRAEDERLTVTFVVDDVVKVLLAILGLVVLLGMFGCGDVVVGPSHVHRVGCGHEDKVVIVDAPNGPQQPVDPCKDFQPLLPVPGC